MIVIQGERFQDLCKTQISKTEHKQFESNMNSIDIDNYDFTCACALGKNVRVANVFQISNTVWCFLVKQKTHWRTFTPHGGELHWVVRTRRGLQW